MLYLIKSNSALKIGFSDNLKIRMIEYKVHNPDFELLDIADGTKEDEKYLQLRLVKYRYKNLNEWFVDCAEVRNLWNSYTDKNGKYAAAYVEFYKPYIRRIKTESYIKYGMPIEILYGRPLINILTNEKYKHIQDWLERERLTEEHIYDLFLHISSCPIRFVDGTGIPCPFNCLRDYKDMKEAYECIPFNSDLYLSNKTYIDDKIQKRFDKCPKWVIEHLQKDKEYSCSELEEIFIPLFEEHGLKWNKKLHLDIIFQHLLGSIKL